MLVELFLRFVKESGALVRRTARVIYLIKKFPFPLLFPLKEVEKNVRLRCFERPALSGNVRQKGSHCLMKVPHRSSYVCAYFSEPVTVLS